MAEIKFYTDEHIAKAVVKGLRKRGIDVKSSVEAKMLSANDEEQLAFAKKEGRVIVTYDNDFLKLHAQGIQHTGIAFASAPLSIGEMISILLLLHEIISSEDMENKIEFI
ncbi:MAG: DUF5615 family PIN-like protein [Saprospiraceae bacterium]|nr:DUF5615 family PIN-like protein [Saprospiraceae bacterium]